MIEFDGYEYELRNGALTRKDMRTGEAHSLSTPYKKMATTENWIYCQTGHVCEIYMLNTKVLYISSYYNNFRAWVSIGSWIILNFKTLNIILPFRYFLQLRGFPS